MSIKDKIFTFDESKKLSEEEIDELISSINFDEIEPVYFSEEYLDNIYKTAKPNLGPQKFLESLKNIRIKETYVLDYFILESSYESFPFVYVRGIKQESVKTYNDYLKLTGENELSSSQIAIITMFEACKDPELRYSRAYEKFISFNKTPEGFLEYIYFIERVNKFKLTWHALYQNHKYYLSYKSLYQTLIDHKNYKGELEPDQRFLESELSAYKPYVKIDGDFGLIRIYLEYVNKGFCFLDSYLKAPNILLKQNIITIKESDMRIMY